MAKRKKRSSAKEKPFVCRVNPGGMAARLGLGPEAVDQHELMKGTKIELEHAKSPAKACGIALDHLVEHPLYYFVLPPAEMLMKQLEKHLRKRTRKG